MRLPILFSTLAYIGITASITHASTQINASDTPISVWNIIHALSDRSLSKEELPILAEQNNCIRCEKYGVRTFDNTVVDITTIYQEDEINTIIIDNFRYDGRKCITMHDVKAENNFTQKDYSFFPIPDSYTVQVGYKIRKGDKEIIFAANTSIKDKTPIDNLCLSLFSISKYITEK